MSLRFPLSLSHVSPPPNPGQEAGDFFSIFIQSNSSLNLVAVWPSQKERMGFKVDYQQTLQWKTSVFKGEIERR